MIANGVDLVTTAAELGHANTTATIYAHQIAIARATAADVRAGCLRGENSRIYGKTIFYEKVSVLPSPILNFDRSPNCPPKQILNRCKRNHKVRKIPDFLQKSGMKMVNLQLDDNAEYVTVQFRDIRVFRRFPANTGKQTQEFAASLCHTLCCERQNHRHFL